MLLAILPASAIASDFACTKPLPEIQQKTVLESVERRYGEIFDLSAEFSQNSYYLGTNQRKSSSGTLSFKKPGKMDWRYLKPKAQRFVGDGKLLWFYEPELEKVTVGDFEKSFKSDLPVSFLLGIGKLSERFVVAKACFTSKGIALKLEPKKSDASLQEFFLLVDKNSFNPLGAQMVDVGGNETTITFDKVEVNTQIADSVFEIEIPKGVDFIDRRSAETKSKAASKEAKSSVRSVPS
ncbi:hypothetical protein BVY02_01405 [bacterium J17]|nr:hypothetical protein BVY02_01405 [bacterium J17]